MLLQPARLTLDANGQPRSDHYQDIYYNPGAGFAESEHVFINGNRLHERIARARHLTIGEIGYGTGLNFIHTADTFLREAPPEARLHYISFELHPIAADTLATLQRDWPQPDIRAAVLAQNPHNHPGHHLIKAHPRIHLHLIQGDIRATLPLLRARVDAWYLDGFAPAKNPECWTPELLAELARHSAPGATAATFSAARSVRDALSQAGFHLEKIPGYGTKRDMLTATLAAPPAPQPHWTNAPAATTGSIAVIGAGIAGSTTARALAESGRHVVLYHSDAHPAASAVPVAVPYLNPDSDATPNRPYQIAAWHHAMRALHQYPRALYDPCGIYSHATDDGERRRQQAILDAALLSNAELRGDANTLHYPRGGVIHLPALLAALADHPDIERRQATLTDLRELDSHAAIIHCCGWQTALLPEPALHDAIRPLRGQGSLFDSDTVPDAVHCGARTLIPDGDRLYSGASFNPNDSDLVPRAADDDANRQAIYARHPDANPRLHSHYIGIRGASRDYMPLLGAIPDAADVAEKYAALRRDAGIHIARDIAHHPRHYMHQGLGSKGCTQAWLNADILAAIINDTPIPLPQPQLERLAPARYLLRALKRGQL